MTTSTCVSKHFVWNLEHIQHITLLNEAVSKATADLNHGHNAMIQIKTNNELLTQYFLIVQLFVFAN